MENDRLTEKQKRFVDFYLEDLNATRAAIRAGYAENSAAVAGHENLRKPKIQKYLSERRKSLQEENDINIDGFIKELQDVAFSDYTNYFEMLGQTLIVKNIDELSVSARKAVKKVHIKTRKVTKPDGEEVTYQDVRLELHDKLGALKTLGEALGYFDENNADNDSSNSFYTQINLAAGMLPSPED